MDYSETPGMPNVAPPAGPPNAPPDAPEPPAAPRPGPKPRRRYRYRSLFWPLIVIGAGVIWLLYSLDVFSASNLSVVGLVWPVFVIGIGADLLLGHRSLLAGAAVGVVTLAIIIVLMAVGPGLGWVGNTELKTETFSTAVGEATEAQIELGLSGYTTSVHALPEAIGADRPARLRHHHPPGRHPLHVRRDHQEDGGAPLVRRVAVVAAYRQRHRDPVGHRPGQGRAS